MLSWACLCHPEERVMNKAAHRDRGVVRAQSENVARVVIEHASPSGWRRGVSCPGGRGRVKTGGDDLSCGYRKEVCSQAGCGGCGWMEEQAGREIRRRLPAVMCRRGSGES